MMLVSLRPPSQTANQMNAQCTDVSKGGRGCFVVWVWAADAECSCCINSTSASFNRRRVVYAEKAVTKFAGEKGTEKGRKAQAETGVEEVLVGFWIGQGALWKSVRVLSCWLLRVVEVSQDHKTLCGACFQEHKWERRMFRNADGEMATERECVPAQKSIVGQGGQVMVLVVQREQTTQVECPMCKGWSSRLGMLLGFYTQTEKNMLSSASASASICEWESAAGGIYPISLFLGQKKYCSVLMRFTIYSFLL